MTYRVSGRSALNSFLNYLPGLIILVFSMLALHSLLDLLEGHQNLIVLYERYDSGTLNSDSMKQDMQINLLETKMKSERLYWSVIAVGLAGFILLILNTHKISTLKKNARERESLQAQIYQSQKMEAVGRLAGGIAHDFNNILAAMNGFAEFLIEDLDKKTPQHGFAVNILQAGQQARDLIDQILAFSRRKSAESENMDMGVPLRDTLSMLSVTLPRTIEVETKISLSPAIIRGNASQIAQVIMNLCVNAKDAMEDGHGLLRIAMESVDPEDYDDTGIVDRLLPDTKSFPPVRIEAGEEGRTVLYLGNLCEVCRYVCLSVSDTGCGMSRSAMEHIFEPFFTTKPVNKGTGLGLSTVHGVIVSHQGAAIIDSAPGKGTNFRLFFPLVEEEAARAGNSIITPGALGGGRVLLAEDQEDVRKMMVQKLERMGFDVDYAVSGEEALEILRENPGYFHLVVTDQNMPKMTGLELVEAAFESFPALPFIVVSGHSEEKFEGLMRQHPSIRAVLRKPLAAGVLEQEVKAVLDEISVGTRAA